MLLELTPNGLPELRPNYLPEFLPNDAKSRGLTTQISFTFDTDKCGLLLRGLTLIKYLTELESNILPEYITRIKNE
jgi:hypothetical protein